MLYILGWEECRNIFEGSYILDLYLYLSLCVNMCVRENLDEVSSGYLANSDGNWSKEYLS